MARTSKTRTGSHRTRRRVAFIGAGVAAAGVGAVLATRRARTATSPGLHEFDRADHSDDLDGTEQTLTSIDGAELAVTTAGPDDAPVVVLAHCWTGSRNTWAPVARRLLAAGCRVVRWDQRGHGLSRAGHRGHTVEALGDDLATVLRGLDLHDVVLVGHSMGGMTVQSLATHHPELFHERAKAAVLVATAAYSLGPAAKGPLPSLVEAAWVERLFERPGVGDLLVRGTFGRQAHPHHVRATADDFRACEPRIRAEFARSMATMDLRTGIAGIDVPTTILVGTRDTLTPLPASRMLAATIPGAELEILPGYGHMLPYEAPEVVVDAVLEHVHAPSTTAAGRGG